MHRREVYLRDETPMIEHDALHSRDVFYHRDSHNHRYASLQPRDYYGPNEPRIDSEFTTRDTSPALDVNVHTQADTAQCSVPTMLMKVDMLDAMALTSAGHLVEEHTVTVGTLKVELITRILDGRTMSVMLHLHLWTFVTTLSREHLLEIPLTLRILLHHNRLLICLCFCRLLGCYFGSSSHAHFVFLR
ncbi:uncharacterized protein HD556DRAFT_1427050 [Suillus plorans]|uniref:Uncharacterized protein n=1 Tax=Suillus plorans TaxID=116603 RepID=A0A9P7AAH1_9AGAM|nr:uncharacterized protein HD556DRAFT_1427050 [Suillus plorans]KAG1784602.1 hypothetical protein HD556DRAFT_1427050 [Suillus plorans]